MCATLLDLHVSFSTEDQKNADTVVNVLREAGLFGYQAVDGDCLDSAQFGLLASIDLESENSTPAVAVLSADKNSISYLQNLDKFLTDLAHRIGHSCYFYEPELDWEFVVDLNAVPNTEMDEEFLSQEQLLDEDHDPVKEDSLRFAFVIYGNVTSPDRYVYELARDVKAPVTLVAGTPTVCFAVDNPKKTPVWLGKLPILEIQAGPVPMIRWFSGAGKGLKSRFYNRFAPRFTWFLSTEPYVGVKHLPLQDSAGLSSNALDNSAVLSAFKAQDAATKQADSYSVLDQSEDLEQAYALAQELGFDRDQQEALVRLLTTVDRTVALEELIGALGLDHCITKVLEGGVDPRSISGGVTAESANFRAETGLHSLTERPMGNSWTDQLRRIDHDRPALGLVLILAMFAASAAVFYLGFAKPSIFSKPVFHWAAYICGAIILIDTIVSALSWVMIRVKGRV